MRASTSVPLLCEAAGEASRPPYPRQRELPLPHVEATVRLVLVRAEYLIHSLSIFTVPEDVNPLAFATGIVVELAVIEDVSVVVAPFPIHPLLSRIWPLTLTTWPTLRTMLLVVVPPMSRSPPAITGSSRTADPSILMLLSA